MTSYTIFVSITGNCVGGQYYYSACVNTPPGYYRPASSTSGTYYVCDAGYYSVSGATACTACGGGGISSIGSSACEYPTGSPTAQPTSPTSMPTSIPTPVPTARPTAQPSRKPTPGPTKAPTAKPSALPTRNPTGSPTTAPTCSPSANPTRSPTGKPTAIPTTGPPTLMPTPNFGLMGFDYSKSAALSADNFACMVDNGFEFFVQRGFVTWHTGRHGVQDSVDPNLCTHLRLGYRAGLDVRGVIARPRPRYGGSYAAAVTTLKRELFNNCSTWSDVPIYLSVLENNDLDNGWMESYHSNRRWIEGFVTVCKKYFHHCGVLSSQSAWESVFGSSTYTNSSVFSSVSVWYSSDGSNPNFKSFRDGDLSFGGWSTPTMKQFERRNIGLCDMVAGFDWCHST
jgi:hypothetical protein